MFPLLEARELWQPIGGESGDQPTRLLATILVHGTPHHLEAIEVEEVDGEQRPLDTELDADWLDRVMAADPMIPATTEIEGRTYVVFMLPFER